jgi:hypoxanthine phosphoribosyltransferase
VPKVYYLNNHLEKFRNKSEIKFNIDEIEGLAQYGNLYKEDKKTTKIFTKCFKNKESYKELLEKLPSHIDRLGKFYLITAYWIAYTNYYHYDNFHDEMGKMLEGIDEYTILLNSPHFCKKVFYYLDSLELAENKVRSINSN